MIRFLGFLPDLDPTTPGAIKDCNNIVPTIKGMKAAPSTVDAGLGAASLAVNSLAVVEMLDGVRRVFVGTANTLEEESGGAWVDRSRATPAYSCGTDSRWSFSQYGNYTLAANIGDVIQVNPGTGSDFANITGSPQAAHIAVSEGFVMACNLSDYADKWHCSAYLDHTDWTEAVSTQCTSGRLISGGAITGVKQFGSGFVAWKKNATYIANYVGAPVVFQWDEIPGDVGCPTGHAAVDVGDRVAFLGHDDFYIFDGSNNIPIGEGIREWFLSKADNNYLHYTVATYNPVTANITWHFISTAAGGTNPDLAVVYNIRSNKWGKYALTIEAASAYFAGGVTFEGLGSLYLTYDDLPTDISYDSPYWSAGTAMSGVVLTDHTLYTLTGTAGTSTLTMNSFGDDELFTTVTRIRPRFLTAPESSNIDYSYDNIYGDAFTYKGTYDLIDGRYDFINSSRWHEVKYNFSSNMEIIGINVSIVEDGTQ